MQEWRKYRLENILCIVKNSVNPCNIDECNYIGLEHIAGKSFLLNDIGSSQDVESNKYSFQPNDILYGKLRPYFQKVYKPNFKGICSTDIYVIRTKNERVVSQDFLYQIVREKKFTEWAMEGHTGTRMPRADWQALRKKMVLLPDDLNEQHRIAEILGALDDKIELNLEINKTLEEMAMAIYKEWFVDFGPFHDREFVDSELGPIPKEWEVKTIENLSKIIGGFAFKSKDFKEEGDLVIKIKNIQNGLVTLGDGNKIPKLAVENVDSKFKLIPGDYCIAMTGAEVGKIGIIPDYGKTLWLNQRVGLFRNNTTIIQGAVMAALFLSGNGNYEQIQNLAYGSAQPNISSTQLENIKIPLPNNLFDLKKISDLIFNLHLNILHNYNENYTLGKLRDYLLPKLISGEIRVKAAEEKLKEVL